MHEGHRNRLRKKFLANGFENFEDHEILEMALFYAIPRRDTNKIAHHLLKNFGSLSAIFDAPVSLLKKFDYIGENAAIYLKMIPNLARIYLERKNSPKDILTSHKNLCDRLSLKFVGRTEEVVAILLLDSKGKIVFDGVITKGSVNAVEIYARKIIEIIVLYNACSILIGHNHPSGFALPSNEDIESTLQLCNIFKNMNIEFIDHIIVADGDYVSLKDCEIDGI